LAAAAKVGLDACLANITLCANQAGIAAANIAAGDVLGGATLTTGAAATTAVVKGARSVVTKVDETAKVADVAVDWAVVTKGAKGLQPGGTVELFTDSRGPQIKGAVSVGPSDVGAIAADARNMPNIPSNSQAIVVANNPFIPPQSGGTMSMMDYLPEAARITQPDGKIVINANGANPYFKSVPTQAQLDSLGLKIEYQGSLLSEYQGMQFLRTDGSVMPSSSMRTIVFVKK
jgi:hypothetical protein